MDRIRDMASLREYLQQGRQPEYLFFWGNHPNADGSICETCLSQWYAAGFELDGVHYRTAEHYMMAEKARLFGDEAALAKVLRSRFPAEVKRFGREIAAYRDEVWDSHRFEVVVRGNLAKFRQNPALLEWLLSTGEKVLVEASPSDAIWGIGVVEEHPFAANPKLWPGLNLLGFALMEVRSLLSVEQQKAVV
ncbi:NADAR family protein [Formivibrio citricus]|nr:NADAR family protein [Formivibrio citricus]